MLEGPSGSGVVGQNSWESVKGLLSVPHLNTPNASLYAPGAPEPDVLDAPGHASTHASSWALPANQISGHQGERQLREHCRHA